MLVKINGYDFENVGQFMYRINGEVFDGNNEPCSLEIFDAKKQVVTTITARSERGSRVEMVYKTSLKRFEKLRQFAFTTPESIDLSLPEFSNRLENGSLRQSWSSLILKRSECRVLT